MSKLSPPERRALPKSAFVFPGKAPASGSYPIHDIAHARNALARCAGKPEAAQVRAAVYARYPTLKKTQEAAVRWVEREGHRFLAEGDGKCAMPHAAMSKRGKKICPNCKAKIGKKEKTVEEAADSLKKASTHKHGLEVAPGKKDNWIERAGKGGHSGQLPAYIQHIALAIEKRGKTKSQAIAIAISTVKRWAAGGGGVDAGTKAAAAKAVGEWTALKAKAHAK